MTKTYQKTMLNDQKNKKQNPKNLKQKNQKTKNPNTKKHKRPKHTEKPCNMTKNDLNCPKKTKNQKT